MKKVLIITYYWPPAGGPGVQRVLKFAKYLPQFGWEPIILTVENGNYPAIDKKLLTEIPNNLKIYKTKTLEPFVLYNKFRGQNKKEAIDTFTITKSGKSFKEKISNLIRTYFFIPDARKGWKYYAVKEGIRIINNENIDLIFSSSPPHSLQLIAKKIAKKTNSPWVADFRDPWSTAFWLDAMQKKGLPLKLNIKKEKSVLNNLSYFTTVSQGFLNRYKKNKADLDHIASIIYNGYDDQDFLDNKSEDNKIFTIRYVGTLAQTQSPDSLFDALTNFNDDEIRLELWGKFESSIEESARNYGIKHLVDFFSYVNHEKAVSLMQSSDMLLLVIPNTNYEGILTGKLYEYIATRRPIIGLGPDDSEAKDIINSLPNGAYFSESKKIESYIREIIELKNANKTTITPKMPIEKFSRKYSTKLLSQIFNKLTNNEN